MTYSFADKKIREEDITTLENAILLDNKCILGITSFFHEILLSNDQIREQNLTELLTSGLRIDDLNEQITKITANHSFNNLDSSLIKKLLDEMFHKKELIFTRIRDISIKDDIHNIKSQNNQEEGYSLENQIEKLLEINEKWQIVTEKNEQERVKAQQFIDKGIEESKKRKEEREAFKEKWAIWKSFLERESVSTIIGALLLIILTMALIIATFVHIETSQIINNGFLVLLGYFFGQTVAKASVEKKEKEETL